MKPAICKKSEFQILDKAVALFKNASRCQLHRDPASLKCKILLLGKWKEWKEDAISLKHLKFFDYKDILGVKLYANFTQTKNINGEAVIKKINDIINGQKIYALNRLLK